MYASRFTLACLAVSLFSYPTSVLAQFEGATFSRSVTQTANSSQPERIRFIRANTGNPDPKGTPPTDHGTGTRGDCPTTKLPLTRLVGSKTLELTASDRPTFWFYVPYTSQEASSGEFFLQDREGNNLYQTQLTLSQSPGIIGFALPSQVKPLMENRFYRWYFSINCPQRQGTSNKFASPAFITGQVQRIKLTSDLKNRLEIAKTPLEKVHIYAQHGIWYDTFTELANLYLNQPQLATIWADLLKEVDLENFVQEPVIGLINLDQSQSPTITKGAQ
jgi:hypothetical protein